MPVGIEFRQEMTDLHATITSSRPLTEERRHLSYNRTLAYLLGMALRGQRITSYEGSRGSEKQKPVLFIVLRATRKHV